MKNDNEVTEQQPHVLVVDDDRLLHDVLRRLLKREGIGITGCTDALQAIEALEARPFDLLLTDFKMPKMDGLELLAHVRQEHPHLSVIMITAHANVQHAVRAMRSGAVDYIPKPFSTTELTERVKQRLKQRAEAFSEAQPQARSETSSTNGRAAKKRSGRSSAKPAPSTEYIGEHESIQALKRMLPRVAQSKAAVFVHGESGTGKEILSRLIHETSHRADGPYVTLNCANLPRELVESHLFGHRKGAFTGAIENMDGAFERADGGTLLLDEVTEVDLAVQAKLLRVLQEQEFQKVGASKTQRVDVRVIATSNRDLNQAVQQGDFRRDLYHRLAVFPLRVPPLRGRLSDIPLLAAHFVEKYAALYGLPEKTVAPELMQRFQSFHWPGNVRQLENMLHRGVVLAAERSEVTSEDVINEFFSETRSDEPSGGPGALHDGEVTTIEAMERQMILKVLAEEGSNQQRAAEKLGISTRTIRNKLKKYREEGFSV